MTPLALPGCRFAQKGHLGLTLNPKASIKSSNTFGTGKVSKPSMWRYMLKDGIVWCADIANSHLEKLSLFIRLRAASQPFHPRKQAPGSSEDCVSMSSPWILQSRSAMVCVVVHPIMHAPSSCDARDARLAYIRDSIIAVASMTKCSPTMRSPVQGGYLPRLDSTISSVYSIGRFLLSLTARVKLQSRRIPMLTMMGKSVRRSIQDVASR